MASRSARTPALAAYVLHRYEWSESSLIVDLFTRELGRIAVAAKGARKPFSQLRAVLVPFQRFQAQITRPPSGDDTREIHNLRGAEWSAGHAMPAGAALWSGFYANELLMKLLARHDPHPRLFDAYADTIAALASAGPQDGQAALRAFELVLLREIGLLPELAVETASRQPVRADRRYLVLADAGIALADAGREPALSGATLAALADALAALDLPALQRIAAASLAELRPVLRTQLHYHLGTSQLRTRQVMIEAQALDRSALALPEPPSR